MQILSRDLLVLKQGNIRMGLT